MTMLQMHPLANDFASKNAFQQDAYRLLQWPSRGVVSTCQRGCLPARGCLPTRGMSACLWVVSACRSGVVCLPGSPPPPTWTEWQTRVKTLSCRNYVADGKNRLLRLACYSQSIFSIHYKGQSASRQITSNFRQNGSESFEKNLLFPTDKDRSIDVNFFLGYCIVRQWSQKQSYTLYDMKIHL